MRDDDRPLDSERRTAPVPRRAAPPTQDSAELPGEGAVVDGKYRVERVLGAGGMGVVVAAMHLGLNERVALKFVKVGDTSGELVERLRREARIAFRIKSEHVARLLDVGALDSGSPYLVMEHLEGQDLSALLVDRGPLPIEEAVDYVLQACEAMAEAHRLGVVHRDLKPSNLFLTRRAGRAPLVKVLDFGIAKAALGLDAPAASITESSSVLGSPLYMSPEQVRGAKTVDARSDLWSLGVILHELVAGAPPFAPGPASAVCAAIAADAPVRLREGRSDAPEELEKIVLRCLEKNAAERYSGVGALAAALAPFAPDGSAGTLQRIASLASEVHTSPVPPARGARSETSMALSPRSTPRTATRGSIRYAVLPLILVGIGGTWVLLRRAPALAHVDVDSATMSSDETRTRPAPIPGQASTAVTTTDANALSSTPPSVASIAAPPVSVRARKTAVAPLSPAKIPTALPSAVTPAKDTPPPASTLDMEERATTHRR